VYSSRSARGVPLAEREGVHSARAGGPLPNDRRVWAMYNEGMPADPLSLFLPPVQQWFPHRSGRAHAPPRRRVGRRSRPGGTRSFSRLPGRARPLAAFSRLPGHLCGGRDPLPGGVQVLYISPLKAPQQRHLPQRATPSPGRCPRWPGKPAGNCQPSRLPSAPETHRRPKRQRLLRRPPHVPHHHAGIA